jgi:hypothetical protein
MLIDTTRECPLQIAITQTSVLCHIPVPLDSRADPGISYCITASHSSFIVVCTHCLAMALLLSHAYTVVAQQQACYQSRSLAAAVSHGFKILSVSKHATTLSSRPVILSATNTLQFISVQIGPKSVNLKYCRVNRNGRIQSCESQLYAMDIEDLILNNLYKFSK